MTLTSEWGIVVAQMTITERYILSITFNTFNSLVSSPIVPGAVGSDVVAPRSCDSQKELYVTDAQSEIFFYCKIIFGFRIQVAEMQRHKR